MTIDVRHLVHGFADELLFGNGPRPEPPLDTQILRDYLPDAVAATLRALAEQGVVLWVRGRGTVQPLDLAVLVEHTLED